MKRFAILIVFLLLSDTLAHAGPKDVHTRIIGVPEAALALPWTTVVTAINNRGVVVGYSAVAVDENGYHVYRAFRWSSKSGFEFLPVDHPLFPTDINDRGEIVGKMEGATGFLWSDAQGLVRLAGFWWDVDTINNRGDIGGACQGEAGTIMPCVWHSGATRDLPTGSVGEAMQGAVYSLNNRGDAVGLVLADDVQRFRAAKWNKAGELTVLPPMPMEQEYDLTVAIDINNRGTIAGVYANEFGPSYALVWNPDGTLRNYGPPQSRALAINDAGIAVGYVWHVELGTYDAIAFGRDDTEVVLGDGFAVDVNDRGQVAGMTSGGQVVMWTLRPRVLRD